ncbi:hypothetical protein BKA62DRAFT_639378 [Auriculariales sp. MPI-PUGE-AT-0066]|nr:hypothetical protein BKA62DRAFT_639378 [Auriculariales sp. MPI-PUGE-AT-0066]
MVETMDVDASAPVIVPAEPLTFLRIKRKRNDTQLDALFIENTKRKRARAEGGLFEYAGTLEDGAGMQALQSGIANGPPSPMRPTPPATTPEPPKRVIAPMRPARKYTIVQPRDKAGEEAQPVNPTPEPYGIVYEAILDYIKDLNAQAEEEQLKNFLPMLENYLKITESEVTIPKDVEQEDDYVIDVFVHRPGAALQSATAYTNVGTVSGLPADFDDWDSDDEDYVGGSEDEDSNAEDFYRNDYPDEQDSDSASDEFRRSDGEGSFIEDPSDYASYNKDEDEGPRLRWRN